MQTKNFILLFLIISIFLLLIFFWPKKQEVKIYPSSQKAIVAFGDSLVEGVGASEGNDFVSLLSKKTGKEIINKGKSGDTTKSALLRLEELLDLKPKIVILLLGGNDYLRRVPKKETFDNLEKIIESLQKNNVTVLLLGIRGGILKDNYKNDFKNLAEKYQLAYVPDVLLGILGKKKYMSDQIHPNDKGYELIAKKVFVVMNDIIK